MNLPPLNGLIALETVIRLKSVSRAAEELGVSQPAVSQRLRALEAHFGRKLIERTSVGFRVSQEVEFYASCLRSSFEQIHSASVSFRDINHQVENRLRIALLSTFAQCWLIPRLLGFQNKYPDIDVHLMTTSVLDDMKYVDADISIRNGSGFWSGYKSEFLVANRIFPVASPDYLNRFPLATLNDLQKATFIGVEAVPRNNDWVHWLRTVDNQGITPRAWQRYANSTHAMEAATAGLGVAMAHSPFVEDSIAAGRLVKPFVQECEDADGDYYLVYKMTNDTPRRVRRFRNWLLDG